MNRRFLIGLLSLLFVSVSAYAQTTMPVKLVPMKLSEPDNLLMGAKWSYSTDAGKTFSATLPTIKAKTTVYLQARAEFDVADLSGIVVLELAPNLPTRSRLHLKFFLNNKQIKPQMKGMNYKIYRAIDAKMLKKGKNILLAKIRLRNSSKDKDYQLKNTMRLAALKANHLRIQTSPILGAFGKDYFTLVVRTNMPAEVTLSYDRGNFLMYRNPRARFTKSSKASLIHRFRLDCPFARRGGSKIFYTVGVKRDNVGFTTNLATFELPKHDGTLRFVAMGDSRTNPKDWAKVAGAVVKAKPDLVVFSGDMVAYGLNDWEWDEHFVSNAKKLLATVPFYAVIGNHEKNAPVYNELFYTPSKDGRAKNWSQEINGVLFIGLDGAKDFSAGSKNYKWLEKTLSESKAKFIFSFNHYPAWSSGRDGQMDKKTGKLKYKNVRRARDVFMALMTKYKGTAHLCGDDHFYERTELPGGLTHIISGGAGAPLREKTENAKKQNPHSKVFASVLHHCLFEIKGNTCMMKVVTTKGKVIDTRAWKARK